jgi:Inositol hexakisphosphate
VSASRIISELNQAARIASLECGVAKIPCLPEVFASNLASAHMNFIPRFSGGRLGTFCFVFSPAVFLAVTLVQKNPPVRPAGSPVLIWDIDLMLASALPRNFRTTDDPLKTNDGKMPSTIGLIDVHASGSGEFTADNLKLLLARLRGPVTIFDLRQETHIFINGLPVSWYATRDWANVGRSQTEIEEAEAAWVQSLGPGSEIAVRPGHPVKKDNADSVVPQQVIVKEASIERDLASAAGTGYVRVAITDHTRPLGDAVDRFIVAVRALPDDAWAHFHCEAGLGRTTTFMVLYDMLRNATRVSLDDIVCRQKLLGYNYDVLRPAGPGNWKAPYMEDRIAFVRAFYNYARANPNGRPRLWSEWLKSGGK